MAIGLKSGNLQYTYKAQVLAQTNIYNYIDIFYNWARRRRQSGGLRTGFVVMTRNVYDYGVVQKALVMP
jgi:hypothetical protein